MSTCPVPWCPMTHGERARTRAHLLELGPFPRPDEDTDQTPPVRVLLIQQEHDGTLAEPFVRIMYGVTGEPRAIEVGAPLASDVGDLVAVLGGRAQRPFASALLALHYLAGGGV